MTTDNFTSIEQIIKTFPTEDSCLMHLEKLRWDGAVQSPFDPISKVYSCKNNNFRCRNSGKYFNAKTGTMFYNSKIPLQKWFVAIWLVTTERPDISSIELGNTLHLTQKSAWYMLKRIRGNYQNEFLKIKSKIGPSRNKFNQDKILDMNVTIEDDKFKMSQWLTKLKAPNK